MVNTGGQPEPIASVWACIDENNIVTRIALVSEEFMQANPDRYQGNWIDTRIDGQYISCAVGWIWDGQTFADPNPPIIDEYTEDME